MQVFARCECKELIDKECVIVSVKVINHVTKENIYIIKIANAETN